LPFEDNSFDRLIWAIAGVLNPSIERPLIRPLSAPNELAILWAELGLLDIEQTSLLIRAGFSCFDDYWLPFTKGEGPHGLFVAGLPAAMRSTLRKHLRRAYRANLPDGLRSFARVAWRVAGLYRRDPTPREFTSHHPMR
jgi:hypothetical protein